MAIEFANMSYVRRSKGDYACRRAAYNGCTNVTDSLNNRVFDYSDREGPVYHEVMLPQDASERYKDLTVLWNTVESHEIRKNAQVAKELLLALPHDEGVTLDDRIALARGFCQKNFVDHGIICQVDINVERKHSKENQEPFDNWYAKILMTTRVCDNEAFGLKARHLEVDVRGGRVVGADKRWGCLWGEYQNAYFQEKGMAVRVEPIGVTPQKHRSPGGALVKSYNAKIKMKNSEDARNVPLVAEALVKKASTFDRDTVNHFANKHIDNEKARTEFLNQFWSYSELVPVAEGRYTIKAVFEEVVSLTSIIALLTHRFNHIVPAHPGRDLALTINQSLSADAICSGPDFIYVSYDPEVDKKVLFEDLLTRYTAAGFVVRGLSCTAGSSEFMRTNRFKFQYRGPVTSFLLNLKLGKIQIEDNQEVWIVDDVSGLHRSLRKDLLERVHQRNLKLICFGDALTFSQDEVRFTA